MTKDGGCCGFPLFLVRGKEVQKGKTGFLGEPEHSVAPCWCHVAGLRNLNSISQSPGDLTFHLFSPQVEVKSYQSKSKMENSFRAALIMAIVAIALWYQGMGGSEVEGGGYKVIPP